MTSQEFMNDGILTLGETESQFTSNKTTVKNFVARLTPKVNLINCSPKWCVIPTQ
jgi:hypothetical protein